MMLQVEPQTNLLAHPMVVGIALVMAGGFVSLMVWIVKSLNENGKLLATITVAIQNIVKVQEEDHKELYRISLEHAELSGEHAKKKERCQHCTI